MGMLINGQWVDDEDRFLVDGAFRREAGGLKPISAEALSRGLASSEAVLVASKSCPWSHRALLVRALKGLHHIPVATAGEPRIEGYRLPADDLLATDGRKPRHLHQLYSATDAHFTGRATVPLIWDRERQAVISNESSVIARGLDRLAIPAEWRLAPAGHLREIDALNAWIYRGLSNAVYRAGLATRQDAYDAAAREVFETLDRLEARLSVNRCLLGSRVSEADLFLFATLVRFDLVYATHFRCTRRRLVDYPSLWAYACDIHSWPGVAATVDRRAIREGYYLNDGDTNPHGIVPEAPEIDWSAAHGRDALGPLTVSTPSGSRPFADMAVCEAG